MEKEQNLNTDKKKSEETENKKDVLETTDLNFKNENNDDKNKDEIS